MKVGLATVVLMCLALSCSKNLSTNTLPTQFEMTTNLLNDLSRTFTTGEAIDNPISIQLLDEWEEPVPDVLVTFKVTGGEGKLLLNNERSQTFSIYTDSIGSAELSWIPFGQATSWLMFPENFPT